MLAVTVIREAVEEIRCYVRDKEVNSQVYSRLTARGQPGLRGHGLQLSQAADGHGSRVEGLGWGVACGETVARSLGCLSLGAGTARFHLPWAW